MSGLSSVPWLPGDCAFRSGGEILATEYGFRPACLAAYNLTWWLLPREALYHHVVNWCLHLLCGGLVYLVARRWGLSSARSGFAASLFLLAPGRIDAAALLHAGCDTMGLAVMLAGVLLWMSAPGRRNDLMMAVALTVACMFKEHGFVFAGLLLATEWRNRTSRWWTLCVALGLATAFRIVWTQSLMGNYVESVLAHPLGLHGITLGLLGSFTGSDAGLTALGGKGREWLGDWYFTARMALAPVAVLCVFWIVRSSSPGRVRRLGLLLLGTGLVGCVFTVTERNLYWCGPGAVLLLAQLRVPSAWLRSLAVATLSAVAFFGVQRLTQWHDANARLVQMRAAIDLSSRTHGAQEVHVIGAPDQIDGLWTLPVSECRRLLDPAAPVVHVAGRGWGTDWDGPTVRATKSGLEILPRPDYWFQVGDARRLDDHEPWLRQSHDGRRVHRIELIAPWPPSTLVYRDGRLQPIASMWPP